MKSEISSDLITKLINKDIIYSEIMEELKGWLPLGTNKLYALANKPGFPTIRMGSKMLFSKALVREYMENINKDNKEMAPRIHMK